MVGGICLQVLDDFWVFRAYVVWAYISLVWLLCLVCEFDLIGGRCGGVWWWFVISCLLV